VSESPQEFGYRCAAGSDASAGPDEVPGREPFLVGERPEQFRRRVVGERQEREEFAPIGCSDDTRREAAEPSAAVVEHDGPEEHGHGSILPGDRRPRLASCRT
jgi:hypothetical protein